MKNGRFYVGLVGVGSGRELPGVDRHQRQHGVLPDAHRTGGEGGGGSAFHTVGVKVSGKVVSGSYSQGEGELVHLFRSRISSTPMSPSPWCTRAFFPDTFTDDTEVVLEGRFGEDGVFQATTLLTKCGSRYEASPEELADAGDGWVTALGEFALWIALPVSFWGMAMGFVGGHQKRGDLVLSAERSVYLVFALLVVASLGVVNAFLTDQFQY